MNPVKLHLDAIEGHIPNAIENFLGFSMKIVLFAKKSFITPKLDFNPNVVDIPPPGLHLKPEDPICTVLLHDKTREKLTQRIDKLVNQIYSSCSP